MVGGGHMETILAGGGLGAARVDEEVTRRVSPCCEGPGLGAAFGQEFAFDGKVGVFRRRI